MLTNIEHQKVLAYAIQKYIDIQKGRINCK